ncbi:unnamed protein product [Brassica rapa]|uniref:superoxide dismutase n=1 Tax=Brassica campestris TaxID=3711 RepID=A0A8D9MHB1_BRACM|nr:unnamed protein product [Brassica rapa]
MGKDCLFSGKIIYSSVVFYSKLKNKDRGFDESEADENRGRRKTRTLRISWGCSLVVDIVTKDLQAKSLLMEGIVATSYAEGDKFYIDPAKLLPLARFLPQPKSCEPLDFLEESCACQGEGGGEPPKGSLGGAIDTHFGSLKVLVKKMSAEGAALQGSGWVTNSLRSLWLTLDTTANQDDDKAAILVPSLLCSDLFVFVFHCSPLLPDKTLTRLVRSLLFHFSVT